MDILSELHWSSKLPLIVLLDFYPLPRSFQKFSWSEWYSSGTVHFGKLFPNPSGQWHPSSRPFTFPSCLLPNPIILLFNNIIVTFPRTAVHVQIYLHLVLMNYYFINNKDRFNAMFTSSWMCLCSNSWLDCPGIKLTDTSRWLWGIRFLRAYFCYTSTTSNQRSRKDKQNTSTYFDFDS